MPLRSSPQVLVIGALAWDRAIRLSGPLAPGARLSGRSLDGRLEGRLGGGGANAAVALARAGWSTALAAVIADDDDGCSALAAAAQAGLDVSLAVRRPGASRTTLILVEPDGERTVIGLDADATAFASASLPAPSAGPALAPRGVLVRAPYRRAEAWARRASGPVVAHWPSPSYAGPADVLVGSADDLDARTLAAPFAAARAQVGPRLTWAVVTRGAGSVTAYGLDGEITVRPPPVRVVDATGAGDVFAAGLLDALMARAPIESALAHACAWGATAAALEGSAPLAGTFRGLSALQRT